MSDRFADLAARIEAARWCPQRFPLAAWCPAWKQLLWRVDTQGLSDADIGLITMACEATA